MYTGTQVAAPGDAALAVNAAAAVITIDDGLFGQNPATIKYPAPGEASQTVVTVGIVFVPRFWSASLKQAEIG